MTRRGEATIRHSSHLFICSVHTHNHITITQSVIIIGPWTWPLPHVSSRESNGYSPHLLIARASIWCTLSARPSYWPPVEPIYCSCSAGHRRVVSHPDSPLPDSPQSWSAAAAAAAATDRDRINCPKMGPCLYAQSLYFTSLVHVFLFTSRVTFRTARHGTASSCLSHRWTL